MCIEGALQDVTMGTLFLSKHSGYEDVSPIAMLLRPYQVVIVQVPPKLVVRDVITWRAGASPGLAWATSLKLCETAQCNDKNGDITYKPPA